MLIVYKIYWPDLSSSTSEIMSPFKLKGITSSNLLLTKIEGERVILSPVSDVHAQDIFREFSKNITRYMIPNSINEIAQADEFIETSRKNMESACEIVLAISNKYSGEFLGICALHGIEHPNTPELGIWIRKNAHGEKLGREAVRYLIKWALGNLDFSYIIYPVDKNNIPSRKIAESLGGVIFKERERESMSGAILNEVVYKIKAVDQFLTSG
jgi:RimJ/RimL family protein N-acetyltransferase